MKENFERSLAEVLKHEGGYVDDPRDPGGETNMGISKRSYPREDIKNMTRERAGEIYRKDYWDVVRGDDLPSGMDFVAFDAAVNSGPSRGAKWLQSALGVKADGIIGPKTIAAAWKADSHTVANAALDARLAWLRGLVTWSVFGRGWTNRISGVRSVASEMAARRVGEYAKFLADLEEWERDLENAYAALLTVMEERPKPPER